ETFRPPAVTIALGTMSARKFCLLLRLLRKIRNCFSFRPEEHATLASASFIEANSPRCFNTVTAAAATVITAASACSPLRPACSKISCWRGSRSSRSSPAACKNLFNAIKRANRQDSSFLSKAALLRRGGSPTRGDDLRSPLAPHRQHLAGLLPLDQRHDMSAPYLSRVAFSGFVLRPIVDAGDPPAPFPKDLPGKKSGAQVGLFRLERLARWAASCTIPIDYLNWPPTSDGSQRCIHSPCKPRSCVICLTSPKIWRAVTCWSRARTSKSTHCAGTRGIRPN